MEENLKWINVIQNNNINKFIAYRKNPNKEEIINDCRYKITFDEKFSLIFNGTMSKSNVKYKNMSSSSSIILFLIAFVHYSNGIGRNEDEIVINLRDYQSLRGPDNLHFTMSSDLFENAVSITQKKSNCNR